MNEYLEQHNLKKKMVIDCMNNAEEFFRSHGYDHEADVAADQRRNVENGEFTIVVVGEFSAGKSTFLNALMGKKILPSYSSETTATVNFLKHISCSQSGEAGKVFYNDGTVQVLDHVDNDNILYYATTDNKDFNVADKINHIDLYLDSKFLQNNVTLVDSPGLNGLKEGHREITERQIERSSASIFPFNAQQPGSKSEFDFLSGLKNQVKSIFYVLNKIDSVNESENQTVEVVVSKLKESYKSVYPNAVIPEIWPVSARNALWARDPDSGKSYSPEQLKKYEESSRMEAFENRLWKFLTCGEKTKEMLMAPLNAMINAIDKVVEDCKKEQEVLSGSVDIDDIVHQKNELEEQALKLREMLGQKSASINRDVKTAQDEMLEALDAEMEQLKVTYSHKLDNWVDIEDIEPDNIKKNIERYLKRAAEHAQANFADSITNVVCKYSLDVVDDLNSAITDTSFGIQLSGDLDVEETRIGIEKYDEDQKQLESQLKQLDIEYQQNMDDIFKTNEINNQRQELERRLERKKCDRDNYEEASEMGIPQAVIRAQTKVQKEFPGGALGFLKFLLNGFDKKTVTENVVDSRERDEYISRRNNKLSKYDREIAILQNEIDNISSGNVGNSAMLESRQAMIEKKRREKEIELDALRKEFNEKVRKNAERQLKKQKQNICDFIDDNTNEFKKEFKSKFKAVKDTTVSMIIDKVSGDIGNQINRRQQELELLQKKMNSAVEEKDARISELASQLNSLSELRSQTCDAIGDIDSITVDKIKLEKI